MEFEIILGTSLAVKLTSVATLLFRGPAKQNTKVHYEFPRLFTGKFVAREQALVCVFRGTLTSYKPTSVGSSQIPNNLRNIFIKGYVKSTVISRLVL